MWICWLVVRYRSEYSAHHSGHSLHGLTSSAFGVFPWLFFFFLKIWFRCLLPSCVPWSNPALCSLVPVKVPQNQICLTPVCVCVWLGADFRTAAGWELSRVWGKPPWRQVVLKQQRWWWVRGEVGRTSVCTQGTPGCSVKRALLFRPLPSRDQGGKYTGSPAPSPLLSENLPQKHPSVGPGFNHPLRHLSSVWRKKAAINLHQCDPQSLHQQSY